MPFIARKNDVEIPQSKTMKTDSTLDVRRIITTAVAQCNPGQDGWINLAILGNVIRQNVPGFDPLHFGFERLAPLLKAHSDLLEFREETASPHSPSVVFARFKDGAHPASETSVSSEAKLRPFNKRLGNKRTLSAPDPRPEYNPGQALPAWAWLRTFQQTLPELADLALEESWEFRHSQPNPERPHPILLSYLKYTFYRLKLEGKISVAHDGGKSFAAFNTGLVDKRYEPIFALFRPNESNYPQPWQLSSFCIAAEDLDGKTLVRHFNPLPEPPHYFDTFSDVLYDVRASEPQLDWEHIILENIDRIPETLLQENCPPGFDLQDVLHAELFDRQQYYTALRGAVKGHAATYRGITNRMKDALQLSLKRVRWNFKTAIPQYFPKRNRISLLLPLALITDEKVDRALVVERTTSGNYLGHTILPLDWAYSNARLVCRPDSDWLSVQDIQEGVGDQESENDI
jgi:hypothetical protein